MNIFCSEFSDVLSDDEFIQLENVSHYPRRTIHLTEGNAKITFSKFIAISHQLKIKTIAYFILHSVQIITKSRILKKITFNIKYKPLETTHFDYIILTITDLLTFRNINNSYLCKILKRQKQNGAKIAVYFEDGASFFDFSSKDAKKAVLSILHREDQFSIIDNIYTNVYNDCTKFNINYLAVTNIRGWDKLDVNYIKNSRYYSPHKYEITNFSSLTFPTKIKATYNALMQFDKFNINYGCNFRFVKPPKSPDITKMIKFLTEQSTIEVISDQKMGNNFVNQILNTDCVMAVSGENDYISTAGLLAIYYDKKYLTDQKSIKLLPFYNPDFIRVVDYSNLTDEDIDWIRQSVDVKYSHKEVLTNRYFLEQIISPK